MRTHFAVATAVALTVLGSSPAVDAQDSLTMAVGTFANRTGDASLDPLSRGLADMLITDLSVASGLVLLERERLQSIVDELALSGTGLIDPKTAQRVGKLVGADLIVVGAFAAVEPTMRLDARLVAVETGEIMATAKAEGPADRFFAVEADLAKKLLRAFGVVLTPVQRMRVDKPPTRRLDALKQWSEALVALDADDEKTAKRLLEAALAADPSFERAQRRLAALEKKIAELERRTTAVERAGGLVLRPTRPAEFWSNYRVHRGRRQIAEALSDLKRLLDVAPGKVDALMAGAELLKGTRAESMAKLAALAPSTPRLMIKAATAIAARDSPAADQATSALLGEERTAVHRWLRFATLGPPVNETPTAEERAEEWALLQEFEAKDATAELGRIMVGQDSLEAARKRIADRTAHYTKALPGGFERGQVSLPGAALHFLDAP